MNDWDKNNLMFIMKLSNKELTDWFLESSEDDRIYAEELLAEAHLEIDIKLLELYDNAEDITEAKSLLNQFTLKGKVK